MEYWNTGETEEPKEMNIEIPRTQRDFLLCRVRSFFRHYILSSWCFSLFPLFQYSNLFSIHYSGVKESIR